jgi:hypothetical protein
MSIVKFTCTCVYTHTDTDKGGITYVVIITSLTDAVKMLNCSLQNSWGYIRVSSVIFCVLMMCSNGDHYQCSGGTCVLHRQG